MRLVTVLCLLLPLSSLHAADGTPWKDEISARREEYLDWILDRFGVIEESMKPLDGRAWSLNQTRLFVNRDTAKASRYFETVRLTNDPDFMGIRLLKTLLDFRGTQRLSNAAEKNLDQIIRDWPMNRKGGISRIAFWPPRFTENHDLMHLTLGLFSEQLRKQPIGPLIEQLKRSLSWRFKRGFYEWGSHRYQMHYSNPLLILSVYAPDPDVRRGAADLFSLMLAERALMSVGGYLGGPGMRSYDRNRGCDYLDNNRYDSFLPTVWLALGQGEPRFDFSRSDGLLPAGDGYGNGRDPRLNQDEAMFLATTELVPHPIVRVLLDEVATRSEFAYRGRRASAGHPFQNAHPGSPRSQQEVHYYNTPHVSLGSLQYLPEAGKMSVSYNSRPRFFSVMFPERPEQVLRTRLSETDLDAGPRSYNYRADRVVQHRDWLIAAGELSTSHGLKSRRIGAWDLFRVGHGLCAHFSGDQDWHVFQVADLDQFPDERSFLAALTVPTFTEGFAVGKSLNGDLVRVNLETMAIDINNQRREPQLGMLHDSDLMTSVYGSGKITIEAAGHRKVFDNATLRVEAHALPPLPSGQLRWGNPNVEGDTTNVAHVRAMGGLSPRQHDSVLRAVSILIPTNTNSSVRLAVYAGGRLEKGPHAGQPAELLFDFGETPKGQSGWLTLEHPTGIRIPAATPIWLAWKGNSMSARIMYVDDRLNQDGFQPDRGRWDSQAISLKSTEPWPNNWPQDDPGHFDTARYCAFLRLEPLGDP